jgi:hypothetical protein
MTRSSWPMATLHDRALRMTTVRWMLAHGSVEGVAMVKALRQFMSGWGSSKSGVRGSADASVAALAANEPHADQPDRRHP